MTRLLLIVALLFALCAPGFARDAKVRRAFQREHPCPVNGLKRGACPGWVVDHKKPLCAGGADAIHNMRWQRVRQSYKKDVQERRACALQKKAAKYGGM